MHLSELVSLDINMPGLDGCETARAIRRAAPVAPCIAAHTALRADFEPLRSGRDLFEHLLTKPVDFEQLNGLLHSVLDH